MMNLETAPAYVTRVIKEFKEGKIVDQREQLVSSFETEKILAEKWEEVRKLARWTLDEFGKERWVPIGTRPGCWPESRRGPSRDTNKAKIHYLVTPEVEAGKGKARERIFLYLVASTFLSGRDKRQTIENVVAVARKKDEHTALFGINLLFFGKMWGITGGKMGLEEAEQSNLVLEFIEEKLVTRFPWY